MISDIANYCRWDWKVFSGKGKQAIYCQTEVAVNKRMFGFIGVNKARLLVIIHKKIYGKHGKVRFEEETEFRVFQKICTAQVQPRYLFNERGQSIEIPAVQEVKLSPNITVPAGIIG